MGPTGLICRASVQKRHRKKHVSLGLCRYCSKKAVKGKTICKQHLNKQRKRKRGEEYLEYQREYSKRKKREKEVRNGKMSKM